MKNLIIFDFDGVLADSFNTFYLLIKASMAHIGLNISPTQYQNLFIDNVHQGFKKFINNDEKYLIFKEFRSSNYDKYYYGKKTKAKLFSEVPEFIKKINEKYTLAIASSGRQENIKNILKESRIENYFGLILADSAPSKEGIIKYILSQSHARPEETFFITDTAGDLKVGKKVGLKTIAVTWGFHNEKLLTKFKPDHISKDFKHLFKILT